MVSKALASKRDRDLQREWAQKEHEGMKSTLGGDLAGYHEFKKELE